MKENKMIKDSAVKILSDECAKLISLMNNIGETDRNYVQINKRVDAIKFALDYMGDDN